MLRLTSLITVIVAATLATAQAETPTSKPDWSLKASDLCAEYVTKFLKKEGGRLLATIQRDPAIDEVSTGHGHSNGEVVQHRQKLQEQ